MQTQPTSVILLAEVRHAELQNEAAQERLARQALSDGFPAPGIVAAIERRLEIALTGVGALVQGGLTSLRMRQRTTLV